MEVIYDYTEEFKPKKTWKTTRYHVLQDTFEAKIPQLSAEEFPVAVRTHQNDEFRGLRTEDYRWDGKTLYRKDIALSALIDTFVLDDIYLPAVINKHSDKIYYIIDKRPAKHHRKYSPDAFTDQSIAVGNTQATIKQMIEIQLQNCIVCDRALWVPSGQPYYTLYRDYNAAIKCSIRDTDQASVVACPRLLERQYVAGQELDMMQQASKMAKKYSLNGYDEALRQFVQRENYIEVLIPAAYTLTRSLESNVYVDFSWDDISMCFVKDYNPKANEKATIVFEKDRASYAAVLPLNGPTTFYADLPANIGCMMMDARDVTINDIVSMYEGDYIHCPEHARNISG